MVKRKFKVYKKKNLTNKFPVMFEYFNTLVYLVGNFLRESYQWNVHISKKRMSSLS